MYILQRSNLVAEIDLIRHGVSTQLHARGLKIVQLRFNRHHFTCSGKLQHNFKHMICCQSLTSLTSCIIKIWLKPSELFFFCCCWWNLEFKPNSKDFSNKNPNLINSTLRTTALNDYRMRVNNISVFEPKEWSLRWNAFVLKTKHIKTR